MNLDDGDRNFSQNSLVTNRLDLLSEFDFMYKKSYGFRVSAALWYDGAYSGLDNTSTATSNTLLDGRPIVGQLSPYTNRYANGPSGEWLDAFVFANVDVGGIPVNVKAGQHTVYWGDSLLLGGAIHGISYAQNSLDVWKGLRTPGAEAKELFRPRGGVTLQIQPMAELSLAAQWFYNWQAVRVPESGSYLTALNDPLQFGGDSRSSARTRSPRQYPVRRRSCARGTRTAVPPSRYSGSLGDWGVSARWSPQWLDGTLGFYYRNATDIFPQVVLTPGFAALPAATCTAIGGIVVAPGACIINRNATNVADLTTKGKFGTYNTRLRRRHPHVRHHALEKYRRRERRRGNQLPPEHAAGQRSRAGAAGAARADLAGCDCHHCRSDRGTPGALGDTWHGLINFLGIIPQTPLFDTATWAMELTAMRWQSVTQNEAVFIGRDNYYLATNQPLRRQADPQLRWSRHQPHADVVPGAAGDGLAVADLLEPGDLRQFRGRARREQGRRHIRRRDCGRSLPEVPRRPQVHRLLRQLYNRPTGAANPFNGAFATLSDRGWVSLTFKTTF